MPIKEPLRTLPQQAEDQAMSAIARGIEARDPEAMENLYAIMRGANFSKCFARSFGDQHVQDMVHDCFLTATAAIRARGLRYPERLMGFLRTVARRRIAAGIEGNIRSRSTGNLDFALLTFPDRAPNPEIISMRAQKVHNANKAIGRGSRMDREILGRFYVAEQSKERVCAVMNLTPKQFSLLKSRAIGRVRDRMLRRAA